MGKMRRNRSVKREKICPNPVGIPSVKSVTIAEENGINLNNGNSTSQNQLTKNDDDIASKTNHITAEEPSLIDSIQAQVHVLTFDIHAQLNSLSSILPVPLSGGKSLSKMEVDEEDTNQRDVAVAEVAECLEKQTQALDILTSLITGDESDEDDDDMDDGDNIEDSVVEPMEEDEVKMEDSADASLLNPSDIPSKELLNAVVKVDLLNLIRKKCRPLPVNVVEILTVSSQGQEILKQFNVFRTTAIQILGDLIDILDKDALGDEATQIDTYRMINNGLIEMHQIKKDEDSVIQVEALASTLRLFLQKMSDESIGSFGFTADDIDVLSSLFPTCDGSLHSEASLIRVMGVFGILLSKNILKVSKDNPLTSTESLLAKICNFLTQFLSSEVTETTEGYRHIVLPSEALDCIFDVFGEDEYNSVIKTTELIKKLKSFASIFKKQIRRHKGSFGEWNGIVDTASTNLQRFINYKRNKGC